jgi:methyl-accepting chemotaxis protein PixJ
VRARVTPDEIGTLADSYNSTITSLRKLVLQVQAAAVQVTGTTTQNQQAVQNLSTEALQQAEALARTMGQIQQMATSIQEVSVSAQQVEQAVQQASLTVQSGDQAMDRTVEGFGVIRETVAETAKKIKRLAESSQKISRVVSLISNFAAQTNLLALNAAIEAARAGEQGRGFAVVAEEVRSLARQSAQATAEIEKLVEGIQAQTREVAIAMEQGTEQVVVGTRLVNDTRASLKLIATASSQIEVLVKSIAQAAYSQATASERITGSVQDVAQMAQQTSKESIATVQSLQELQLVAQALQSTVGQFKVN